MIPQDIKELSRILIVKPSSLGDIVHTLPLLACLRRAAPGADIRWLVNSGWAPLLRAHPLLNGLVEFPRNQIRGMAAPLELCRWLASLDWRPDLALDVQGLLRSALLARSCRARRIVGYSDAREGANFLHHHVVDVSARRSPHAVDRYLTALDWFGIERPPALEFPLPPGDEPACARELPGRFVVVHPFSRGQGKSLSHGQVERLAESLALPAVVVGMADQPELRLRQDSVNLLNRTTLPELIWLLRRASWVVSVDSGPMHLAAAITSRLLAIHTWSDPAKVGPYVPDAWVWKGGALFQAREGRMGAGGPEFPDSGLPMIVDLVNSQTGA